MEANLNQFDGINCLGELFNPNFVGYPSKAEALGVTQGERDKDPLALIEKVKAHEGIAGFRLFHDHDQRAIDHCLKDRNCAKIVLTRNALESFVSWKIASATGQWKLTNVAHARNRQIHFDRAEFERYLAKLQDEQLRIQHRLRVTGQTAYFLDYEDIRNVDVINGMARFLGGDQALEVLDKTLKKQNPAPLSEKVSNPAELEDAAAGISAFDLSRTPNLEPRRGPAVPTILAAADAPVLYLPIRSGPVDAVKDWLRALDGDGESKPRSYFTQKTLRQWKRERPGHRSFTVIRHPLARAHDAFCRHILTTGPGSYLEIRRHLIERLDVPLPAEDPGPELSHNAHRAAFEGFLRFLQANLSGQTAIRVDASWASQHAVIKGFAAFCAPDAILREERLEEGLSFVAGEVDVVAPEVTISDDPFKDRLAVIYDNSLEKTARDIYGRDFMSFGFGRWADAN